MRNLLENPPKLQITRFDSCDSTNQLLLHAAESGAEAGSVFVAREQTAGRGRRGREWIASPDQSLTFSLLWAFSPDPARLSGLSLAVGLAVVKALSSILSPGYADVRLGLKWPNDLLIHRADGTYAKVGGMLIESALRTASEGGKELAVVIGIGLNCGDAGAIRQRVIDQLVGALSELYAQEVTPEALLLTILEQLRISLSAFAQQGFAPVRDEWNACNLWQNHWVQIREGDTTLHEGLCQGVDAEGALCIKTASSLKRIVAGDVSLRKV